MFGALVNCQNPQPKDPHEVQAERNFQSAVHSLEIASPKDEMTLAGLITMLAQQFDLCESSAAEIAAQYRIKNF